MPHSRSLNSYRDVKEIFDRAISEGGVRITCQRAGQAINLRARLNHFRALDRDFMAEVYPLGHEKHGVSNYDPFVVRIVDSTILIEPRDMTAYVIEPLNKPEEDTSDKTNENNNSLAPANEHVQGPEEQENSRVRGQTE